MSFLTPHVFDVLVIAIIIVGLILAAMRIRADFKSGRRWLDEPVQTPHADQSESSEGTHQQTKDTRP